MLYKVYAGQVRVGTSDEVVITMSLLISKAKKHDKIAFQQLIEQHEKAMYQMAKAILKNDDDVADQPLLLLHHPQEHIPIQIADDYASL